MFATARARCTARTPAGSDDVHRVYQPVGVVQREAPGHHAIALVTLTLHEDLDLHLTPLLIGHLVLVLVLVLVLHLLVPLSEYRVPGVLEVAREDLGAQLRGSVLRRAVARRHLGARQGVGVVHGAQRRHHLGDDLLRRLLRHHLPLVGPGRRPRAPGVRQRDLLGECVGVPPGTTSHWLAQAAAPAPQASASETCSANASAFPQAFSSEVTSLASAAAAGGGDGGGGSLSSLRGSSLYWSGSLANTASTIHCEKLDSPKSICTLTSFQRAAVHSSVGDERTEHIW